MPLNYALYGHPDARTYWEQKSHHKVLASGFERVPGDWDSLFYHPDHKLMLTIYVDDFRMAGAKEKRALGWKLLTTGENKLELGDPAPPDRSLGCYQRKIDITLDNGAKATAIEYDMRDFLKECVSHYVKIT